MFAGGCGQSKIGEKDGGGFVKLAEKGDISFWFTPKHRYRIELDGDEYGSSPDGWAMLAYYMMVSDDKAVGSPLTFWDRVYPAAKPSGKQPTALYSKMLKREELKALTPESLKSIVNKVPFNPKKVLPSVTSDKLSDWGTIKFSKAEEKELASGAEKWKKKLSQVRAMSAAERAKLFEKEAADYSAMIKAYEEASAPKRHRKS
jgi:hypothetical protein